MGDRDRRFACKRGQKGESLRKISEMLALTEDEVAQLISQSCSLSPLDIKRIFCMKAHGLTIEEISQDYEVNSATLKGFLPNDPYQASGYD
jgi:hypothetical protein